MLLCWEMIGSWWSWELGEEGIMISCYTGREPRPRYCIPLLTSYGFFSNHHVKA